MRAALLAVMIAPALAAAAPTKLSDLPARPVRYGLPKHVPAGVTYDPSHARVEATSPTCVVESPPDHWISGHDNLDDEWRNLYADAKVPFGIERLVTLPDGMFLERTLAEIEAMDIKPTARSWIRLHPVAHADGVDVYAYATKTTVYLVTRFDGDGIVHFDTTRELGRGEAQRIVSCGVALTQIRIRKGASRPVDITGKVPGGKATFVVVGSLTQTSRDPEPILSVTAKLIHRAE